MKNMPEFAFTVEELSLISIWDSAQGQVAMMQTWVPSSLDSTHLSQSPLLPA